MLDKSYQFCAALTRQARTYDMIYIYDCENKVIFRDGKSNLNSRNANMVWPRNTYLMYDTLCLNLIFIKSKTSTAGKDK